MRQIYIHLYSCDSPKLGILPLPSSPDSVTSCEKTEKETHCSSKYTKEKKWLFLHGPLFANSSGSSAAKMFAGELSGTELLGKEQRTPFSTCIWNQNPTISLASRKWVTSNPKNLWEWSLKSLTDIAEMTNCQMFLLHSAFKSRLPISSHFALKCAN